MTSAALAAALPFPPMTWVGTVAELTDHLRDRPTRAPLVVKSRWSRRGDVVACVTDSHDLDAQCAAADEPVIVQKFHDNDGWDYKLYVVGARVLAVRRRSPLGPGSGSKIGVHVASLPSQWVALARTTGKAFGLEVYGVDLLHTRDGPLIVDVNPFPGGRGVDGMASALAELAEWHADDARARGESSISPAP
jgi:ribosomal protein S6--L-glutamate ligase